MREYEITIQYDKKNSGIMDEKSIMIDIKDYIDSYGYQEMHAEPNWMIRETKKEYLKNFIQGSFERGEKPKYNVDEIISELDSYIELEM